MKIENSEKMPSRSNTAESPNACGSALREAGRRIRSARARSSRRRCACCSPDPLEFPLAARRSTRQKTPTSDCLKNALSATRLVHSFGLILFLKKCNLDEISVENMFFQELNETRTSKGVNQDKFIFRIPFFSEKSYLYCRLTL